MSSYYTDSVQDATYDPLGLGSTEWARNAGVARTRNVVDLRIGELLGAAARPHRRREPVVIDGQAVSETLRERLERESRELETAILALAGRLTRRTEQLERLKRFPEKDPFKNGDHIAFEKSFPGTPERSYSYGAHKVDDRWYITGARSPQGVTWDALLTWMGLGVEKVYKLTARGRRKVIDVTASVASEDR